jgi:hypothetical protein
MYIHANSSQNPLLATHRFLSDHTIRCLTFYAHSNGKKSAKATETIISCSSKGNGIGCDERLRQWIDATPEDGCKMKLVIIEQRNDEQKSIGICLSAFESLFKIFKIHNRVLELLLRNVDGFYDPQLDCVEQAFTDCIENRPTTSFYFHVRGSHKVIWSYDPNADFTSVMVICDKHTGDAFRTEIVSNQDLICFKMMPVLACSGHLLKEIDLNVHKSSESITQAEALTGGKSSPDLGLVLSDVSKASVKLAEYRKQLSLVSYLAAYILDMKVDSKSRLMEEARMQRQNSAMTMSYVQYLEKKAKTQHLVVRIFKVPHFSMNLRRFLIGLYYSVFLFFFDHNSNYLPNE